MTDKVATALQIVTLLVQKGAQAGVPIQNAMVTVWGVEQKLEDPELGNALQAAGDLKWVDNGPQAGTIMLTEEGFKMGRQADTTPS